MCRRTSPTAALADTPARATSSATRASATPPPARTCNAACAGLGATCSDAGGFSCGYNGDGILGTGNCGGITGHDYDNSAIGGGKGIDWLGITCASTDNATDDYFECHCVVP
jgi:hypothetical protein